MAAFLYQYRPKVQLGKWQTLHIWHRPPSPSRMRSCFVSLSPEKIWGSSWESDIASLRVHMATLRKKLEKDPDTQYIQTHIGIGYRMLKVE